LNKWLLGARLKTLSAAISPVLIGTSFAQNINWFNAGLSLIVACALQIGVNFANDYSDGIRGTDKDRLGPTRLVAAGLASAESVKKASLASFFISAVAGAILSFRTHEWLILIGAISIMAAWGYTGGKKPYGYLGFGEVSVFVFFGLVATLGSYYIQSNETNWKIFMLSIPVGSLSCAILVINNLRDLATDKLAAKRTLAVRMGDHKTRAFYVVLLGISQGITIIAALIDIKLLVTLICLPLTISACKQIYTKNSEKDLVSLLAKTAQLQILLSLITACALFV
jgi:1,4-dihydroxy-2-naphthoate octaprenyltransferase